MLEPLSSWNGLVVILIGVRNREPQQLRVVVVGDGSQILPDQMAQHTPHLSLRGSSQVLHLMGAEKAEALHEEYDLTDTNPRCP